MSFRTVDFFFILPRRCGLSAFKPQERCRELFSCSSSEELGTLTVLQLFSALTVLQSLKISLPSVSSVVKTVIKRSGDVLVSWSGSDGLDADWVTVLQVMSRLQSLNSLFSRSSCPMTPTLTDSDIALLLAFNNTFVFGYPCNLLAGTVTGLASTTQKHKYISIWHTTTCSMKSTNKTILQKYNYDSKSSSRKIFSVFSIFITGTQINWLINWTWCTVAYKLVSWSVGSLAKWQVNILQWQWKLLSFYTVCIELSTSWLYCKCTTILVVL